MGIENEKSAFRRMRGRTMDAGFGFDAAGGFRIMVQGSVSMVWTSGYRSRV